MPELAEGFNSWVPLSRVDAAELAFAHRSVTMADIKRHYRPMIAIPTS